MIRLTTPLLEFELPFSTGEISILNIAFKQRGRVVLEKGLSDVELQKTVLLLKLTQEDTEKLIGDEYMNIQLRCVLFGDEAIASDPIETYVDDVLKDGVLK